MVSNLLIPSKFTFPVMLTKKSGIKTNIKTKTFSLKINVLFFKKLKIFYLKSHL